MKISNNNTDRSPNDRKSALPRKNGFNGQSPKEDPKDIVKLFSLSLDAGNLGLASSFVQTYKETMLPLKDNGLCLRLCDLNGTVYMGQKFMLEGWENLYLPKRTRMEVLGTLESTEGRVTGLQWIILLGEDGRVYAYDDEELHLVAKSFSQFVEDGIQNTGISCSYPHDVSDEEDESVQHDEEIQKIRQRTRDFIDQSADEFDDFLNFLSS